jgi:hypothetical protein
VIVRTVYFNGIHAETGTYAFPPQPVRGLRKMLRANPFLARNSRARQAIGTHFSNFHRVPIRPSENINGAMLQRPITDWEMDDLASVGWGILYPEEERARFVKQLTPLLELRRAQAGPLYREIPYRTGQRFQDILENLEAITAKRDSPPIPHYLLIVGKPTQIPYFVQYGFDRRISVGRVAFDDLEDYGRYARNIVRHDHQTVPHLKTTLFGTRHPDDPPSEISARFLVKDLGKRMSNSLDPVRYRIETRLGEMAGKQTLTNLMGGSLTPDLLLTATHGVILPPGARDRHLRQGAPICGEWPGPLLWKRKPLQRRMVFSGSDVYSEMDFNGMIAFMYACYGGGTPSRSSFPLEPHLTRGRESYQPFVAHLPKRMLALENGCRAVIAHVDTAFFWSFTNTRKQEQTETYQAFFRQLLEGKRIGFAMNVFQQAYMERLADYQELVEAQNAGRLEWEDDRLVQAWFAVNDLRNLTLLGDPAVRLPALNT